MVPHSLENTQALLYLQGFRPDTLYDRTKAFDWSSLMNADKTFSIDSTVYSEEFRNYSS